MSRRILLLFAHPAIHRSSANRALLARIEGLSGITIVDLYGEYPMLNIDIEREQQRLLEHDVVVFMFPMFWYSTPSILKEWQDLVLEYGFAYGHEGTALHGKLFLCALTAGGLQEAYTRSGHNRFSPRELLVPLEQTAELCGMRYLPPFVLFDARTAADDERIDRHGQDWCRLLSALRDDTLDLNALEGLQRINEDLDALLENAS